jgi:hypothetical protein
MQPLCMLELVGTGAIDCSSGKQCKVCLVSIAMPTFARRSISVAPMSGSGYSVRYDVLVHE